MPSIEVLIIHVLVVEKSYKKRFCMQCWERKVAICLLGVGGEGHQAFATTSSAPMRPSAARSEEGW